MLFFNKRVILAVIQILDASTEVFQANNSFSLNTSHDISVSIFQELSVAPKLLKTASLFLMLPFDFNFLIKLYFGFPLKRSNKLFFYRCILLTCKNILTYILVVVLFAASQPRSID